jgi:hypothetical protein
MMRLTVRRSLLVLGLIAISALPVACASSVGKGPSSPADQLAVVTSTCEQNGGSSLLPRQDVSAIPDAAPAICRCWVEWIRENVTPRDQDNLVIGVVLSASAMSLTDSVLERLVRALRTCETRNPSEAHGPPPEPATSSPGP